MKDIRLEVLVAESDILNTFGDTNIQQIHAAKTVEFLKKINLLDLRYNSPKLEVITVLGCLAQDSGTLSVNGNIYFGQISCDISPYLKKFKNELELTFSIPRNNDYTFSTNGTKLARYLIALGFSRTERAGISKSTKLKNGGPKTPDYLTRLITEFDEYNDESKDLAKKLLRKMVYARFTALLKKDRSYIQLGLHSQPSGEELYKEGMWTISALNILYGTNLNESNIHPATGNNYINGYITIPLDVVLDLSKKKIRFPAGITISPKSIF